MSLYQRHIKSQININYEESYAFKKPTTTAFISTQTMETDEEKTSVRQASEIVYAQPRLAEDQEAEGQEASTCFAENMEGETVGFPT